MALSSTEAEYMALSQAVKEAVWLRRLLKELGVIWNNEPTTILEDNQSAIALGKNPVHHSRTKHIDIRYHFIRELIEKKEIDVVYMPTEKMVADALTKGLPKPRFEEHRQAMGVRESRQEEESVKAMPNRK